MNNISGIVVPLDRSNVDTDAIIPKQYLKSIKRTGFGPHLFDDWRYLGAGGVMGSGNNSERPLNPDFILNQERYKGANILLTRANFGCGSSREHAPWALKDYGFEAIIASSFADIFLSNCFQSSLLPIILDQRYIQILMEEVEAHAGYILRIALDEQLVRLPDNRAIFFSIDPFRKRCLLEGLDNIALTLKHAEKIRSFEQRRRDREPWIFT